MPGGYSGECRIYTNQAIGKRAKLRLTLRVVYNPNDRAAVVAGDCYHMNAT